MSDLKSIPEPDGIHFEELEANFRTVIAGIINDRSLDAFRSEYEKLFEALRQSNANTQALLDRCRQLNSEINTNSVKVQTALKYSYEDQRTIAGLREEFDKAWSKVEFLHARESKNKSIIEALKIELTHLTDLTKEGNFLPTTNDVSIQDVTTDVDTATSTIKTQTQTLKDLQQQVENIKSETKKFTDATKELKEEEDELNNQIESANNSIITLGAECRTYGEEITQYGPSDRELHNTINSISETISEHRDNIFALHSTISKLASIKAEVEQSKNDYLSSVAALHKELSKKQSMVSASSEELEKMKLLHPDNYDTTYADKLSSVSDELEKNKQILQELKSERHFLTQQLKEARKELSEKENELLQITRKVWSTDSQKKSDARNVNHAQSEYVKLKNLTSLEKEETARAVNEVDGTQLNINLVKSEYQSIQPTACMLSDGLNHQEEELAIFLSNLENLNQQIDKNRIANRDLEDQLRSKYQIREKLDREINESNNRLDVVKRKIAELNHDSNVVKNELSYLGKLVLQMKEQIHISDKILIDEHLQEKECEAKSRSLSAQVSQMTQKLAESNANIEKSIIAKLEKEHLLDQSKAISQQIRTEIEIGMSYNRSIEKYISLRTLECKELHEKARVQANLIARAKSHYEMINDEIRNKQEEFNIAFNKRKLLTARSNRFDKLMAELLRLEKETLFSKTQFSLLESEAQKPRLIHRWSLLTYTDPEKMELIHLRNQLIDQIENLLISEQRLSVVKHEIQGQKEKIDKNLKRLTCTDFSKAVEFWQSSIAKKEKKLNELSNQTSSVSQNSSLWLTQVKKVKIELQDIRHSQTEEKLKTVVVRPPELHLVRQPFGHPVSKSPRQYVPKLPVRPFASMNRAPQSARLISPIIKPMLSSRNIV